MLLNQYSSFVHSVTADSLPADVLSLAKAQLLGMIGSTFAGGRADEVLAVQRVARRLDAGGEALCFPSLRAVSAERALYVNSALSCVHDYDDYLFLAHSGHSAVHAALAAGLDRDATIGEVLAALVASNEVMGRLGAACLVGPQNGQLWTFVHLAGGAIGAAKILGLSEQQTMAALSIAFSQPTMALWPGFGSSSAKLLSASTPALTGYLAALHAAEGLTGSAEVLDGARGFLELFTYVPLTEMVAPPGEQWLTRTVSIKPLPGCAYVTAVAETLLDIQDQYRQVHDAPIPPELVSGVHIEAQMMTCGMQGVLGQYARGQGRALNAVGMNFSVPYTAAMVLTHGRLDVEDFRADRLRLFFADLCSLAARVTLRHDGRRTVRLVSEFIGALGRARSSRTLPMKDLARGLFRWIGNYRRSGTNEGMKIGELLDRRAVKDIVRSSLRGGGGGDNLESIAFRFGCEASVRLSDGRSLDSSVEVPLGASDQPAARRLEVAERKFAREAAFFCTPQATTDFVSRLLAPDALRRQVRWLFEPLVSGRRPITATWCDR